MKSKKIMTYLTSLLLFLLVQNNISANELVTNGSIEPNSFEVFTLDDYSYNLTKEDFDLMTKVVYAESNAEPYEGKVAVASVILNRLVNSKFPNTIEGVIKQKNAFSCVINGNIDVTPNEEASIAVIEAIRGNDPTNDALFFYNPEIATSKWMHTVPKANIISIGKHVFFHVPT